MEVNLHGGEVVLDAFLELVVFMVGFLLGEFGGDFTGMSKDGHISQAPCGRTPSHWSGYRVFLQAVRQSSCLLLHVSAGRRSWQIP